MTIAANANASTPSHDFTLHSDFEHWWTTEGKWVEEPNERRNGWSGVMRILEQDSLFYVKRQFNHLCYTFRHPFGWPTTSREWHYLRRLEQIGLAAPKPVFHATRRVSGGGTEAVLVTRELRGFVSLDTLTNTTAQQRTQLAQTIGDKLGRLHRARLQHSCLYDKHVMVRWDDETPTIALIDLEKMRTRLTSASAARHDLEQFQRRQHLFSAKEWEQLVNAHQRSLYS